MKKSLVALLMMVTFAMTFTGCKKDEEKKDDTTVAENTWVVDGTTYQLVSALVKPKFTGASLGAAGTDGTNASILTIDFASKPTASGTYTIKSPGSELGATDVSVLSAAGSKLTYSTGKSGDVAKVTVSGGKVRVEISNIEVEIPSGSGSTTVKGQLSANILEN